MASMTMTDTMWQRVTELGARIRARKEAASEALAARSVAAFADWERRQTAADKRFYGWAMQERRDWISAKGAAKILRVPLDAVLHETRGLSFRRDFGRSRDGKLIIVFIRTDLERYASQRLRGAA